MNGSLKVIGIIKSPFQDKFGIPRQANLIDIPMEIKLLPPFNRKEALLGLDQFEYIWIIFRFNQIDEKEEKISVRPPRLGGNTKKGVFATRSPFRPNRLGLSCVKLIEIKKDSLIISGGDFLNSTPVLDIKPYLKYCDSKKPKKNSWPDSKNEKKLKVKFLIKTESVSKEKLKFIKQILSLDPRPSFHKDPTKIYKIRLYDYELHFTVSGLILTVHDLFFIDRTACISPL